MMFGSVKTQAERNALKKYSCERQETVMQREIHSNKLQLKGDETEGCPSPIHTQRNTLKKYI